jgi:RNA-directed DNA polymerase
VVSPLLANIYLHELDRYWWQHYGGLSAYRKRQRRDAGMGNPLLLRYADDFILITNGTQEEAIALRDEFQHFLSEELKLELSLEKTVVTHVNDGFDFLGFHIRRYLRPKKGSKPVVLVKPSMKNIERFRAKIRDMTGRHRGLDNQVFKIAALNRVLRGWVAYYRHVNAKDVVTSLDFWVEGRLAYWLCDKHKCGIRQVLRQFQHQQGGRKNLAVRNERGQLMFLYCMADLPITRYPLQKRINPYLKELPTILADAEAPIPAWTWNGGSRFSMWKDVQQFVLERDGYRCQNQTCGASDDLDVHHKRWLKDGGNDEPDNLTTLCVHCHRLEQQGKLVVNW